MTKAAHFFYLERMNDFLILTIQLKKFTISSTGSTCTIYQNLRRPCCLTKNAAIETDKQKQLT